MSKLFVFLLGFILLSNSLFSQQKETLGLVEWHSFQEAMELSKKQPRKIFIDVYTDWCGWCKTMMRTTFSDPQVAGYINANYYAVRFNAEDTTVFEYKGEKYYKNAGGSRTANQLAVKFLGQKLSYPSIVYLDEEQNLITSTSGYLDAAKMLPPLVFMAENIYKTTAYDKFNIYFASTFIDKDTSEIKANDLVKWYTLKEAIELNKQTKKKIFLDVYADWSLTSKIMYATSYNHPMIAEYLNKNFYPVHFNAMSTDTITMFNNTYINTGQYQGFHPLVVDLIQGKMIFPTIVYMEENKVISAVPGYFTPRNLEPVLYFFAENKFVNIKWEEFIKTFQFKVLE